MSTLNDPETGLDRVLPPAGRDRGPAGAGGAGAGRRCSPTWPPRSRRSARTRLRCSRPSRRSPPTIDTAVRSFRVQRPSWPTSPTSPRRLRPAVQRAAAVAAGHQPARSRSARPVLPRTVALNGRLGEQLRRPRRPVREPQHAAGAARPAHHADRGAAGDGVRRALPDGLQLLELLRLPAGRAPVRGQPAGRHGPAAGRPAAQHPPGQQPRLDPRLAAGGHAARRRPRGRQRRPRAAAALLQPALPAGHRRPGQRRLPGRPERLHQGPARPQPLQAGHRPPTATPAAATARSASPTSRSCPAAPTCRASWASTTSATWTSCADGPRRRNAGTSAA